MMRSLLVLAVVGLSATFAVAAEVELPEENKPHRGPRGLYPAPRYYEPPAPRVRLGDICVIEDSRSGRSCDLRRAAPVGSYCECMSPSGRAREGYVAR